MNLGTALLTTARDQPLDHLDTFANSLDAALVTQALEATGTASVRRRKLPAERAVWLMLGMALLRDRSIQAVCDHLHLVLPDQGGKTVISSAGLVQARDRLGIAPLKHLFDAVVTRHGREQVDAHRWRGLAVLGIDGTTLRVPDSDENRSHFTLPSSGGHRESAYPQARVVGLMALGSHFLLDLKVGAYTESEESLSSGFDEQLPDHCVLMVDRGLLDYRRFYRHQKRGEERHWLVRAKSNLVWSVLEILGPNEVIAEVPFRRPARRSDPTLPRSMRIRVICYQLPGFKPQWLLTSMLDAERYPAAEIIELYHQRWELETGFDELHTHTLERLEALRSQTPDRIRQELFALAVVYNLVRLEMARVAGQLEVSPLRISYRTSLLLIRTLWLSAWVVAAGRLPQYLEQLTGDMALLVLPARRPRSYPRAVKIKMTRYPRKVRASAPLPS